MAYITIAADEVRKHLMIKIVRAYVSHNATAARDVPHIIASVYSALAGLSQPPVMVRERQPKPSPAKVRNSITPIALFSFIDGNAYTTLKRHLTSHGLSPRSYRERYGLPADYPMVAPEYSERRSALAKAIRLGHR